MREVSSLQLRINTLAGELVSLAREKNVTFGAAESCTGGLICASVTDVAGASAVFWGGIVSYDNRIKMGQLGVKPETLALHGAVSRETAGEMAWGALGALGVEHAVSVTGIAGPDGGTKTKPVGLVYIAVASKNGTLTVRENHFSGDRTEVRLQTVETALSMLADAIRS